VAWLLLGASWSAGNMALAQEQKPASEASTAAGAATSKRGAGSATAGPRPETEPTNELERVIVTGVTGATKAGKANVSYSVLSQEDIDRFTPISAADMLRDLPGVNIETNDGVARSEVYTRGMSIGSGGPTAGYFWSSILEDGMPVLPVKFSGFQDGNFYRADISTSKVEAVRGGSTGTTVASSVGGVFNFLSGPIRPGASLQTRIGFEGDDLHLSWREVNAYYGWVNETGDLGARITGFYRTSNGPQNPGYKLNDGSQVKLTLTKSYESAWGNGDVSLTFKHLDDMNSAMSHNFLPAYGYQNPEVMPGFGRNADMFMHGGQHQVPKGNTGESKFHDPEKGYQYKQDAVWLKWDHDVNRRWKLNAGVRVQNSGTDAHQYQWKGLYSLWSANTFGDQYNVYPTSGSLATQNLNRMAGYYELYDRTTGKVRSKIYNNVGSSQGAINYRTGAACATGSATNPVQCISYNDLPMSNFDLRGGLVNGIQVPAGNATYNTDVVMATKAELTERSSKDYMLSLGGAYKGDNFNVNAGLFALRATQRYISWGSGFGLAPLADGGFSNLGARFVTSSGTYQLTDEGGWGRLGSGFGTFDYRSTQRELSPFAAVGWSPTERWDLTASFKLNRTKISSENETWTQNTSVSGSGSRTYGGLDGNALTWYDNSHFVPPATKIRADRSVTLHNYSASAGYTLAKGHKVYLRVSETENNINGAISRYTTQASLSLPLLSAAILKQQELAYLFNAGRFNGQATYFRTQAEFPFVSRGTNTDGTDYLTDELRGRHLTQGLEVWGNVKITPTLSWKTSATYTRGKTLEEPTVSFGSPGPADDVVTRFSGPMRNLARWTTSNTATFKLDNFWFNIRHRWMDRRKVAADPADLRYLPKQNNVDLGVQYVGIKDTRISLDVRNLTNTMYISQYDTFLNTVTGVTKSDIYSQLPDSASWLKTNASRSIWLTVKHDF
jgi:outer membrane receptor protein involved in Fe transport